MEFLIFHFFFFFFLQKNMVKTISVMRDQARLHDVFFPMFCVILLLILAYHTFVLLNAIYNTSESGLELPSKSSSFTSKERISFWILHLLPFLNIICSIVAVFIAASSFVFPINCNDISENRCQKMMGSLLFLWFFSRVCIYTKSFEYHVF